MVSLAADRVGAAEVTPLGATQVMRAAPAGLGAMPGRRREFIGSTRRNREEPLSITVTTSDAVNS